MDYRRFVVNPGVLFGRLSARLPAESIFRQRRFWAAAGGAAVVLSLAGAWTLRSVRRAEVRHLLNVHAPFHSPPLEIVFPRLVAEETATREVLEPGVRLGLWSLARRSGQPGVLEVRLTDRGIRLFSVVGNQVLATFTAGTREVTRVLELGGAFPSRRVRFRYVWKSLHASIGVLGAEAPEIGTEYDGEALLSYEQGRWNVMHWSTPVLDDAVARFRALPAAAGRTSEPRP